MKRLAITFALLAVAGCAGSEEEQLENAIRENLSNQGTVQEVDLTQHDDNNMNGFVVLREPSGRVGRLACTAQRSDSDKESFAWRCQPAIDEAVLTEMEGLMREELSKQAEVVEVDMRRENDDNHMAGFARVRVAGTEARLTCTAERDSANVANFNWECRPDEDTGGK